MKLLKNNKFKIFLTVFLVYLFYIAPNYLTANTNRYIFLTKSIVEDKTFNVDKYYGRTRDMALYKDHYYIGAAPGFSLLAVPIYIVLKPLFGLLPENIYQDMELNILNLFFTFFLSVLPGALLAVLLYDLLARFGLREKERMLIVLASSFGTILFFYSTKCMAHTAGAFALFSAFYIIFKSKHTSLKSSLFFLAGIGLGLAVLIDYMLIVGSILILLYALSYFKKDKILNYVFLILGLFLIALIFMYYHYRCFGNPFTLATAHSQMIGPVPVSLPRLKFIYELTLGLYRGAFMYMPILLVSVFGIFVFFLNPEKKYLVEMTLITLFSVTIFLVITVFCNTVWPWGGDFGPRYFVCVLPFLMIPMAFAFKKMSYKAIFWFAAISIFINWCGVQYGDTDNVFVNIGLFIFKGLNSNLARWAYKIANDYIRKFNVLTHFSPFTGFIALLGVIYLIWKEEIGKAGRLHYCKTKIK